jgi:hypothetical protein
MQAKESQARKPEDYKPSLQQLKDAILNIESFYTDCGVELQREWDFKAARDTLREKVAAADSVQAM